MRAAERVRFGLEECALETSSGPRTCQVSIGIAVTNPSRDAVDPRTLIGFASSAVDRAEQTAERIVLAGS